MKFDPVQWSSVYGVERAGSGAFQFVRGCEIARDLCSRFSNPHEHWLDAGCGTGHLAGQLAGLDLHVVALDFDPRMVMFARERYCRRADENNTTQKLVFVGADAEALPLRDATMHGVVATSLVGCLPSTGHFFREVHRVLRPGGHAVITYTNKKSPLHRLGHILPFRLRHTRKASGQNRFQFYEASRITSELQSMGFQIQDTIFYNFFLDVGNRIFPPVRAAKYCERLGQYRSACRLGRNFIVVMKKP